MNRRQLLKTASATAALALGGGLRARPARAAGADLKFLFIFNRGGWDPTRVFAAEFSNNNVSMEADAESATAGGLRYVDHADRPSVAAFFADNHSRMLVCNGVQVRSINHEVCAALALTGGTSGSTPDWPAILAAAAADRYALPHLVLGGASFPGSLGAAVARTGQSGQLEGLLSGGLLDSSDQSTAAPSQAVEGIVDRFLLRRAAARNQGAKGAADSALATAYAEALDKAYALKDYRYVMDFTGGATLADQAAVAAEAFSQGLSRCVTLGFPGDAAGLGWDSHADNDNTQSPLWEELFADLGRTMLLLDNTLAPSGAPLSEETVVVVFSEMGRTPAKNSTDGKDHWPYTSALLLGPGLSTDRVVGSFDDNYAGDLLDPATGEADEGGTLLSVEALGATLLALGDVDPAEWVSGADAFPGLLA